MGYANHVFELFSYMFDFLETIKFIFKLRVKLFHEFLMRIEEYISLYTVKNLSKLFSHSAIFIENCNITVISILTVDAYHMVKLPLYLKTVELLKRLLHILTV